MPLDTSIPLQVQIPQLANPADIANAMARQQAAQQEMQMNALRMQYMAEDRARAEENRRAAAAQAAAAQRRQQELMGIYGQFGATPAAVGQRGAGYSGTGVSTDPYAPITGTLIQRGFLPQAEEFMKLQKSAEELPGTRAESRKKTTAADVADYDAAVARLVPLVRSVRNGPDAAGFTNAMYDDPILGPQLEKITPRAQAVARAPAEYEANPVAWMQSHMLTGKELAEALTKTGAPQPTTLPPGAVSVDMNPQSPTYGQVIARGGPTAEEIKTGQKTEGKKSIDVTLDRLREEYGKLQELGAAPSEERSTLGNIPSRFTAAEFGGQLLGVNPKAQTSIQNIEGLRNDLITAIKNATGMSAQEMNSNVELQRLLAGATSPGQNIEAVLQRLSDISARYGGGKDYTKKSETKPAKEAGEKTTFASDQEANDYFKQRGAKAGDQFKVIIGGQSGTWVVE